MKADALSLSISKSGKAWFAAITNSNNALVACSFSLTNRKGAIDSVLSSVPQRIRKIVQISSSPSTWLPKIKRAFRGQNVEGKLDLSFVSPFRRRVYYVMLRIPRGKVTTYGAIAKRLGSKSMSRAVGTAVGSNPVALIVPCHRVVPSSLCVGNYGMGGKPSPRGTKFKLELLRREGVILTQERIAEQNLWKP